MIETCHMKLSYFVQFFKENERVTREGSKIFSRLIFAPLKYWKDLEERIFETF